VKIRREQLAAFEVNRQRGFERQVAEYIRAEHGGLAVTTSSGPVAVSELSTDALISMVRYSIAKARAYSITWESGMAAFAVLLFILGPKFDEHPLIRRELTDAAVPVNSMVDHLCCAIPTEVWDEVKATYSLEAWTSVCPDIRLSRREGFNA
jgi:hypothetical protein